MTREYAGAAPATTLSADITGADLTFVCDDLDGYPLGATGSFVIAVDPGLPSEEKILVEERVGNTVTVATGGRGYDGTAAVAHTAGAEVIHSIAAQDFIDFAAHIDADEDVHAVGSGNAVVGTGTEQTFTNKTIDGGQNTLQNVPQSAVTGLVAALEAKASTAALTAAVEALEDALDGKAPATGIAQSAVTGLVSALAAKQAAVSSASYSPALTAAGGGLNMGSGAQVAGRYQQIDTLVHLSGRIYLPTGGGRAGGTGQRRVSVPVTNASGFAQWMHGTAAVQYGGTHIPILLRIPSGETYADVWLSDVGDSTPTIGQIEAMDHTSILSLVSEAGWVELTFSGSYFTA